MAELSERMGIMQGRLLPPYEGCFQAFPATSWREEFSTARDLGLRYIEWVFDQRSAHLNPLASDEGLADMERVMTETGVQARSICGDFYMVNRLVGRNGTINDETVAHLRWMLERAGRMKAKYIVLPFVDNGALNSPPELEAMIEVLRDVAPDAEKAGVGLHFESALTSQLYEWILSRVDHPFVRATYDMGDRAALGVDMEEDMRRLAPWIGSVHIKDRPLGGTTVPLGQGAVEFDVCFRHLAAANYEGLFIIQIARGAAGEERTWQAEHYPTVMKMLDPHFG